VHVCVVVRDNPLRKQLKLQHTFLKSTSVKDIREYYIELQHFGLQHFWIILYKYGNTMVQYFMCVIQHVRSEGVEYEETNFYATFLSFNGSDFIHFQLSTAHS
jgi:hypothetical protein